MRLLCVVCVWKVQDCCKLTRVTLTTFHSCDPTRQRATIIDGVYSAITGSRLGESHVHSSACCDKMCFSD